MKFRIALFLFMLTPGISYATDPKPEPVRRWIIATYKTLAKEARENPLSQHQKMWDKLGECVPEGPIELRARVQSLSWKDGVARVMIDQPLGWFKRTDVNSLSIRYTNAYYILVSEEEAPKLRLGEFVIIKAKLKLFLDQVEFASKHSKTHLTVLAINTGTTGTAQLASDAIEFEIGGSKYPVVKDR